MITSNFLFFTLFATALLGLALIVILAVNPVYSLIALIGVFITSATLLFFLGLDLLALLLIVVYVGAIAVLFLFVVMMLNIHFLDMEKLVVFSKRTLTSFFLGFISLFLILFSLDLLYSGNFVMGYFLVNFELFWVDLVNRPLLVESLGYLFYTYYFVFFIVASLILLVAMVGAILLSVDSRRIIKKYTLRVPIRDIKESIFVIQPRK